MPFHQPDDPGVDPKEIPVRRDVNMVVVVTGAAVILLVLYALVLGV